MRSPIAVVIIGVFVALAGCGGGTSAGGSSSSRSASGGAAALEVTFRKMTPGSDSAAMVDYDAVLQGGKVRLMTIGYPDESGWHPFPAKTFVYDGRRELIHDIENITPYQQIENAATAKSPGGGEPALAPLAQFLPFDARTAYWRWLCPQAKRLQDGMDLGRPAVQYSCQPTYMIGNSPTIWVDKAFGIALGPLLPAAAKFIGEPHIDVTTFSTEPPAAASADVIGTALQPGDRAPAFTVTEVPVFVSADKTATGRPISSSEFAARRYVLAFLGEGVLWDSNAPEVGLLRQLDELTAGGTSPAVLGVLITGGGFVDKGGLFASKGWHFRIAYDDSRVQHKFGFSDQLDFAFINADGTISALFSGVMSKSGLQAALADLK